MKSLAKGSGVLRYCSQTGLFTWLLLVLILLSPAAWAQSERTKCQNKCGNTFPDEHDAALLSHDPSGFAVCTCVGRSGDILGVYRWSGDGWGGVDIAPAVQPAAELEENEDPTPPLIPGVVVEVPAEEEPASEDSVQAPSVPPPEETGTPAPPAVAPVYPPLPLPVPPPLPVPSPAPTLGGFPYNAVERPLTLEQEMFQAAAAIHMNYVIGSGDFQGQQYDHGEYDWGQFGVPLALAVGLTDFMQLGLDGTVHLSKPSSEFLEPTLTFRVAPIRFVAVELSVLLPDTVRTEQGGLGLHLVSKYPIVPETLAVVGGVGFDHNNETDWSELDFDMGFVWSFVNKFYLGGFVGVEKEFASEGTNPKGRFPMFFETGFNSHKQIDLYLRWGTPGDLGDGVTSVRFVTFGFQRRL